MQNIEHWFRMFSFPLQPTLTQVERLIKIWSSKGNQEAVTYLLFLAENNVIHGSKSQVVE